MKAQGKGFPVNAHPVGAGLPTSASGHSFWLLEGLLCLLSVGSDLGAGSGKREGAVVSLRLSGASWVTRAGTGTAMSGAPSPAPPTQSDGGGCAEVPGSGECASLGLTALRPPNPTAAREGAAPVLQPGPRRPGR